ncbi:class I SAM-dependent methyltransferase [Kitasatospora sp. HPMI-4]|uniref:class I SAM-dependent methyltransferase n=1 Tax=Kitasatospora sp. HPMI-4 TaxID=3448443 RepID=UPI003F1E1C90
MAAARSETVDPALTTYESLAPFYDRFTRYDDYLRWSGLLDDLMQRHIVPGRRLWDVACGTGKSTAAFRDRGYRVLGCDLSAAMIAEARAKPENRGIEFHQADMRDLPGQLGTADHDVVLCMDDAVNNLVGEADLDQAFALYMDAVLAAFEDDVPTVERSSARGVELSARYGLRYWKAMLQVCQGWALAHR